MCLYTQHSRSLVVLWNTRPRTQYLSVEMWRFRRSWPLWVKSFFCTVHVYMQAMQHTSCPMHSFFTVFTTKYTTDHTVTEGLCFGSFVCIRLLLCTLKSCEPCSPFSVNTSRQENLPLHQFQPQSNNCLVPWVSPWTYLANLINLSCTLEMGSIQLYCAAVHAHCCVQKHTWVMILLEVCMSQAF